MMRLIVRKGNDWSEVHRVFLVREFRVFPVQHRVRRKIMLRASPRSPEVAGVSTEKKFGVECKNPQCRDSIVLGIYMAPPQSSSDFVNFVVAGHWKLICPSCGDAHDYNQGDLRAWHPSLYCP